MADNKYNKESNDCKAKGMPQLQDKISESPSNKSIWLKCDISLRLVFAACLRTRVNSM